MMLYCVIYINFDLRVLFMIGESIFLHVQTEISGKTNSRPTYSKFFSMLRQYKNVFIYLFIFFALVKKFKEHTPTSMSQTVHISTFNNTII